MPSLIINLYFLHVQIQTYIFLSLHKSNFFNVSNLQPISWRLIVLSEKEIYFLCGEG